ncbi:DNA cytosine methyltransferase [Mesorhizobium qingshengii]|uniref:DNA (cytosine-5-)-methyltransferase n=1 Tax=Mesorhizobium qingshengii TaxID=1165689 RepID=A0ABT4R2J4_9HYPH|nr:DNA cytosine methyltransferase [Mesorhizobium qingshengii]MCZ8548052.1 DNA cytosine methyltransferase [Mesorhizobium qingshengii]
MAGLRAVDLFCGAGGFALGLKRAGFEIVKSLDFNLAALAVHSANLEEIPRGLLPTLPIIPPWRSKKRPPLRGRLSEHRRVVQHADLMDILSHGPEMATIRPDIIVGGPPCQPYSRAGPQRGDGDWRSALTEAFAIMIACGRPRYFVMENVPELTKSHAYKRVVEMFRALGYGLTETAVDASLYGAAQGRNRWICAGALNDSDGWLLEYLEQYASVRHLTVADELGSAFGATLEDIVIPGRARVTEVQPKTADRKFAREGGHTRLKDRDVQIALRSLPTDRFYFCRPGGAQTPNVRVIRDPSPTVTGKSTGGVGKDYEPRPVDWIDLRKLPQPTFEEFSRLCGFPTDWKWDVPGYRTAVNFSTLLTSASPTQTEIKQMLGNAVAPPLAECIGRAIADHSLARVPTSRSSKCLREGTGDRALHESRDFEVPTAYSDWLKAHRLFKRPKDLSQELSNLRRAKREVAARGLASTRDELAALDRVLQVALAPLNDGMRSSLRRALRDFADWEDQDNARKAELTSQRKARKRDREYGEADAWVQAQLQAEELEARQAQRPLKLGRSKAG